MNVTIKFQENPYDMFRQNYVSGQTDILIPIHYPQTLFYGKNNKFIKKRGACCLIQKINNIWAMPDNNNNNHASCGGLGACRLIQQQNNIWATPDNTWQQPCIMWPKKNSTVTTVVTHREKCSARTWGDRHGSQIQKAGSLWKR